MILDDVFEPSGLATREQLLSVLSRKTLAAHLEAGALERVWHGVYAQRPPDLDMRLAGLDLMTGKRIVACMHTAATIYGFATEADPRIHILDPGVRMRPNSGLMVHQRLGAPLRRVGSRLVTAPAWTSVETARALRRPRALATLDAALRSGACTRGEIEAAIREQKGRRGIVNVRELVVHADERAESAMESETRLVFIDGGLPKPELQYEIIDRCGKLWRVDFAWPWAGVVAEYDSMEWHANPTAWKRDRVKYTRLGECGWTVVPVVVDDVRRHPTDLVSRVQRHLDAARLAG
ncbi:Uncharacterised protein [Mycolicibacterium vanbaalenii]|uniref:Cullin, a subunit of E3 ubiquitin ligase n=1 Tax=Mycolicibacterium vanbaalenii TaxID=110539 RepID=A0A5S9R7S2_MYCVN|nr:hypothetical protein [Mycolicibacterium vanbaalenii]CAA0130146.1 Uncharacterised protein [Mycolicibacterium vanbaalenii]